MLTNILSDQPLEQEIANLFTIIGQPTRLHILIAIGTNEVCVCHLEAALNMRQAVISQHLILLKNHNLVSSRKDARYNFYRLTRPELLSVISAAAVYLGIPDQYQNLAKKLVKDCSCPICTGIDESSKICQ